MQGEFLLRLENTKRKLQQTYSDPIKSINRRIEEKRKEMKAMHLHAGFSPMKEKEGNFGHYKEEKKKFGSKE